MLFSELNRMRCEAVSGFHHKLGDWSLSDWMTATLGELGEAANIIKKLNRIRDGIKNTKGETEGQLLVMLADELADADIYLDLMYQRAGINRAMAVRNKFNATSRARECDALYFIEALTGMTATVSERTPEVRVENTSTTAMPASVPVQDESMLAKEREAAGIHPPPQEFTPDEIATDPILRYFHYAHLPEKLRSRSAVFCSLASIIVRTYPRNAERSVALRKLLEAKDAAVRASVEP